MPAFASTATPPAAVRRLTRNPVPPGRRSRHASRSSAALSLHAANLRLGDTPDYFSGIWTPDLLDHLSEPLTRYHE